ncbi:MAG: hypothetical protein DK306_000423 [Chloroflexi bacterium]|nr:MAG: hypothetical protein DK306_000423 [Chloroflexota bacterium]
MTAPHITRPYSFPPPLTQIAPPATLAPLRSSRPHPRRALERIDARA